MFDQFTVTMFGALFAVMNPFVNLPIFLSLTPEASAAERRALSLKIAVATAVMCAVISVSGAAVLTFFGVTTDAFRVAGALVLAQIGFHMLNGAESPAHHGADGEKAGHRVGDIAFYPMTFPMLVGPGTITALIVNSHAAADKGEYVGFALVVGAVVALVGLTLFFSGAIGAVLSATARSVMTRLMGMILIAIAVEMFAKGVKALLPGIG